MDQSPFIDFPPLQRGPNSQRIRAQYLLETTVTVEHAAAVIAGEQSCGTFTKLAQETDELRQRVGAQIEAITLLDDGAAASLPVAGGARGPVKRGIVEISWGLDNFAASLPNLLATVAGNLFELREISGLRLLDIDLPTAFAERYQPPQFGVEGTLRLAGLDSGPLVGTIIKPSVGLSPQQTAQNVQTLCDAGIDFIKDDELQSDGPHCPFDERVSAVMDVINRHAEHSGRKVMYAFNITGDFDEMRHRHDTVLAHHGSCVMISLNSVGLVATQALRTFSQLPVHGHRNGWGALSRHPALGFEYRAWQKFWRLAGVDHMHVNGLGNKFSESDESVIKSARTCLTPMFEAPHPGFEVMPVFSSGQWARQPFETFAQLQSNNLIYAAGGGIMAHPQGIAAGVDSIRMAWRAAADGLNLQQACNTYPTVAAAVDFFGS